MHTPRADRRENTVAKDHKGGLTLTDDQSYMTSLSPELHSDHQAILNKMSVLYSESSSL